MDFVEGTYRLPGRFWEVVLFSKGHVADLQHQAGKWESGITGVVFTVPKMANLSREYVLNAMSQAFGQQHWVQVRGPDSMILR